MSGLIPLTSIPAVLSRERAALAQLVDPEAVATFERRAAAIADLVKRAGLAVPVQNEATLLRAEALERLAVLVDGARENGELPRAGDNQHSEVVRVLDYLPDKRRVAEGRSLAKTGVLTEMEEKVARDPETSISMADILKQAKRREREDALRSERAGREEAARAAIEAAPEPPYSLVHTDLREWRPEGVAAIVTDPPYVGDSIPLYEALRDFSVDVLPEGGALVVMTWQPILPAVFDALRHPELAYRWTICWRYANNENTVDYTRRVFDCWKPVLVYHKGAMPADAPMVCDEIASATRDKDFHEWGQSVAGFERLVRSSTRAGDTVCDPFLGGGTTAVAALALHRRFVGCDIDADAIRTTKARLAT